MFEPYSPCPCGSGKKFKWCCQPIHEALAKVFALDEEGQHDAALRLMEEIVAQNPTNPEAWGRKALLLFQNEKPEEAEKTLEKAFELQPSYAFGYFLKARFRLFEGEVAGGLLLLRKAAELYDLEARDILAQIYLEIFDCEMKLNHPIAAHAAAELAAKFNPANDNLRKGITTVFGQDNPNLPPSAIRTYEFKKLPADAPAERRTAWTSTLKAASTGKLTDATRAFEQLTQAEGAEAIAWYNLALCQAWIGNHAAAVASLDRYVAMESEEKQAAQAWTLAEVLRLGQGMEEQADTVEYTTIMAVKDPNAFVKLLGEMERDGLLAGVRVNEEEGVLTAAVLDTPPPALTPELQARQNLKLAANVMFTANIGRLWGVNREALEKVVKKFTDKLGANIAQMHSVRGPAQFRDTLSEGMTVARGASNNEEALQRFREGFTKFIEEQWIHRPLKSLGGVPPIDAAGHGALRKKLRGVVQFLRECGEMAKIPYDFERLSHKLGLDEAPAGATAGQTAGTPASTTASGTDASGTDASGTDASGIDASGIDASGTPAGIPARDFASMSASDLAGLQGETLRPAELEQAYQAALKLDARELAGKFASDLVSRPAYPERPDRFPLFQLLINQSLATGDSTAALDRLNEGEKDDCENNGGKRRNDYELRRAQVHAKAGEIDQAEQVFDRLIARVPAELNIRASAAETMLSVRQGAKAHKFAQQGIAEAVKQNNRDLEGHFKELLAAAKK